MIGNEMTVETNFSRALVVLAEALVSERRVLVVGDSSHALHELLADLGARVVHVYDPDAARAHANAAPNARGTVVRPLPEGDFEVRDGAFDLAIVPDVLAVDDGAVLLARLRRVVGSEGAVLCAAPNRQEGDALDYYALYDRVALQFTHVRMIAAMPFAGVTMAELGQDEVDAAVRVDTQLAGDRPAPTAYVALASQRDVALDAYAVIELEAEARDEGPRSVDAAALAEARLRGDVLESQVHELAETRAARARAEEDARRALEALEVERQRVIRLEHDLDALVRRGEAMEHAARAKAPPPAHDERLAEQLAEVQVRAAALEEGVELAEKTIVVQRDRIAELEVRAGDIEEQLRAAQNEAHVAQNEVRAKQNEVRVAQGEVRASESALRAAKDEARQARAELERALAPEPEAARAPDAAEAEPEAATLEAEVLALEAKLLDRGEKVASLEVEVARREKLVRELVTRLQPAETSGEPPPELAHKLDELALLAARQESELEARAWRIAELSRRASAESTDTAE